jgi:class 3 adenylate cyclase
LGDSIRRAIAAKMLRKFRDNPEVATRLAEKGLIDPTLAGTDPAAVEDPVAYIREVGVSLAERLRERPSLLARLDLSALDLLGEDSIGTSHAVARSRRDALTVVFTDLEGFTAFTETEGDDAATELLTDHYGVVKGVVRARGGDVVKRLGDGHLLSFGSPSAAVLAGLEIVELAPDPLRLRAGAHAGEVMVSSGDLLGHVVNIASRVAGTAAGGQALVTTEVREPAGDVPGVAFEFSPPRPLKGIDDAMGLWEVRRA